MVGDQQVGKNLSLWDEILPGMYYPAQQRGCCCLSGFLRPSVGDIGWLCGHRSTSLSHKKKGCAELSAWGALLGMCWFGHNWSLHGRTGWLTGGVSLFSCSHGEKELDFRGHRAVFCMTASEGWGDIMMTTREHTPEGSVYVCIYLCVHVYMDVYICMYIHLMQVCLYVCISLSLSL